MNDLTVLSSTPIVEFNTLSHILMIAGVILIILSIILFFMKILKTSCIVLLCVGILSLIIPHSELPIFIEEVGQVYQYMSPNGKVITEIFDYIDDMNIDISNVDLSNIDLSNLENIDVNQLLNELQKQNMIINKIK